MRFYFNPCFSRYSFEKGKQISESGSQTENKKMVNKNHNCVNKRNSASGDNNNINEKTQLQHETFDMDDNYRQEDSLTLEFHGHNRTNRNKKRKRYVLLGIIAATVLLIIAGIAAYLALQYIPRTSTRDPADTQTATSNQIFISNYKNLDNKTAESYKNNSHICNTKKCKIIAENLKRSMNFSVDPCQNFHEYACGLWPKYHTLPPSMPKLDTMSLLNLEKTSYLKNLIEKELAKAHEAKGFKNKILKFYRSCIDIDATDARGAEPLLSFISQFGRWSPVRTWTEVGENQKDITSLVILSHQFFTASVYDDRAKSPLFKSIVKVNDLNSKEHIFEITIPDLPISDFAVYTTSSSRSKSIRAKYKLLQTNYIALLGPAENAAETLEKLMEFEIKLANITQAVQYIENHLTRYNLTTIEELQIYLGNSIDWYRYVQETFKPLGIKITKKNKIGIRYIEFLKAISQLIAETPEQIVKDYIIWVCVWKFGSYASRPFLEADYNFKQGLLGITERPKQWKKCVSDIEETMEFGLASLYIAEALNARDKSMVTEMVVNITRAFSRNLVNVDWMDVTTKAAAFAKVKNIKHNIGYPESVKNTTFLDLMYRRVHVSEKKYFENALNMYKEKRILNLQLLDSPVDREAYELPPTLVEAYFDPNKNKMVFLAGILHMPFYDIFGPMALNFGALGLVIGHEVTHAFDNIGRLFDGNGEQKNWWTDASSEAFDKRSDCIAKQYSNYTLHGLNVNGKYTLGENIADNGGIKVSYMAYKEWERINGREQQLPGIPLNVDQLFFVSMGQVWCGMYRKKYALNALKTDYHSPAKFRIIGPLSNLKEFSDAFKCPVGSPMNPVKKCQVW